MKLHLLSQRIFWTRRK